MALKTAVKDHYILRNLGTNENIPLISASVTLGRSEACEIVVDSSEASRAHAEILLEDGQLTLKDMGSTNGTTLNGRKLKSPATLAGGDIIIIGQVHYMVVAPGSGGDTTIIGGRLGKAGDNYVLDQDGDPDKTGIRTPFPKPPGWSSEEDFAAGIRATDSPMDLMADQMVRQAVALETTAAALMIVSDEGRNTLFPLADGKDSWTIGRAASCDAEVDHITVSGKHVTISRDGGSWRVEDEQSTNGSRLNGKAISKATICDGEILSVGTVEMLFKSF